MAKEKSNIVYDTEYFKKQGSKGGNKLRELKKDDPDFYHNNGIKASAARWKGHTPKVKTKSKELSTS